MLVRRPLKVATKSSVRPDVKVELAPTNAPSTAIDPATDRRGPARLPRGREPADGQARSREFAADGGREEDFAIARLPDIEPASP